jgi:hypothetical protein
MASAGGRCGAPRTPIASQKRWWWRSGATAASAAVGSRRCCQVVSALGAPIGRRQSAWRSACSGSRGSPWERPVSACSGGWASIQADGPAGQQGRRGGIRPAVAAHRRVAALACSRLAAAGCRGSRSVRDPSSSKRSRQPRSLPEGRGGLPLVEERKPSSTPTVRSALPARKGRPRWGPPSAGRAISRRQRRRTPPSSNPLSGVTHGHALWCIDFKGDFLVGRSRHVSGPRARRRARLSVVHRK